MYSIEGGVNFGIVSSSYLLLIVLNVSRVVPRRKWPKCSTNERRKMAPCCYRRSWRYSAALPVLFYSVVQKWGFRLTGATRCPDKREIWHGGVLRRFAPSCQISRLSGQKCGKTAPKTVKISNFGHKIAPQGSLVCPIFTKFSNFIRVSRWILSFYFGCFRCTNNQVISIFPRWRHFPSNFQ